MQRVPLLRAHMPLVQQRLHMMQPQQDLVAGLQRCILSAASCHQQGHGPQDSQEIQDKLHMGWLVEELQGTCSQLEGSNQRLDVAGSAFHLISCLHTATLQGSGHGTSQAGKDRLLHTGQVLLQKTGHGGILVCRSQVQRHCAQSRFWPPSMTRLWPMR